MSTIRIYTEEQVGKAIELAQKCEHDCGGVYFEYEVKDVLEELTPIELPSEEGLLDKLFNLANEFAVAGYGKTAVILHTIHNGFDVNEKEKQ